MKRAINPGCLELRMLLHNGIGKIILKLVLEHLLVLSGLVITVNIKSLSTKHDKG